MSDNEFLESIDATLLAIEAAIEASGAEIETTRSGNILTLEFEDGSKIVINSQVAMHELWVAAKSGGFHYRPHQGQWLDSRSAQELFAALSQMATQQSGQALTLHR